MGGARLPGSYQLEKHFPEAGVLLVNREPSTLSRACRRGQGPPEPRASHPLWGLSADLYERRAWKLPLGEH